VAGAGGGAGTPTTGGASGTGGGAGGASPDARSRDSAVSDAAGAGATDGGAPSGVTYLYVGSGFYSAGPSGLVVFKLDPATGGLTRVQSLPSDSSPSFFALAPNNRHLYVNIESSPTSAAAYAIDQATGMLSKLNQVRSGANGSAYMTIDATGKFVLQANYSSFSVSVLSVMPNGELGSVVDVRMQGDQAFPHCVRVDPTNRFVFVPNRTGNTVSQYKFDAATGKLSPNSPPSVAATEPRTGPRHIDFHPNRRFAYVINESNASMTAYTYDAAAGTLTPIHSLPTIPAGAASTSPADMHVHPSGRFLYGANRGHGSLAIFSLDATTGRMTVVGHQMLNGKTPRNFAIDPSGRVLAVGVQDSNTVALFKIDQATGKLESAGAGATVMVPSGIAITTLPGR
jgi:6-phosphogluconolactonase